MIKTHFLKRSISSILYYSGYLYTKRQLSKSNSIILTYHRVLPRQSNELLYIQPGMYVTTETFESHMQYIAKKYSTIPLGELVFNDNIRNTCFVTFDDGWYDNYSYALPILKKYSIPATIFLTTNMIGKSQWPWPDRISFYINNSKRKEIEDIYNIMNNKALKTHIIKYNKDNTINNKELITENVIKYLKGLDEETKNYTMDQIDLYMEKIRKSLDKIRAWLNWEEVKEMESNNVTFGSHTHNHVILTRATYEQVVKEITESKEELRKQLNKDINLFSYPNGDYNMNLMTIVKDQGFRLAVTTTHGTIDKSESPLALRRISIHNDVTDYRPMFVSRITK